MTELQELINQRNELNRKIKALKHINHGKVWLIDQNMGYDTKAHKNKRGWNLKITTKDGKTTKNMALADDINEIKNYMVNLRNDLQEVLTCLKELEEFT